MECTNMAVNTGVVHRVSLIANPRTFDLARCEEKYKELSRLQRCPILRIDSSRQSSARKPFDSLIKMLTNFGKRLGLLP